MRTTLTLDPDVVQLVETEMRERRRTMKDVVNEALRSALGRPGFAFEPPTEYTVQVHHAALAPGLDPAGFNRLADELDDHAVIERARNS